MPHPAKSPQNPVNPAKNCKSCKILQPLKNKAFAGFFAGFYRICRTMQDFLWHPWASLVYVPVAVAGLITFESW